MANLPEIRGQKTTASELTNPAEKTKLDQTHAVLESLDMEVPRAAEISAQDKDIATKDEVVRVEEATEAARTLVADERQATVPKAKTVRVNRGKEHWESLTKESLDQLKSLLSEHREQYRQDMKDYMKTLQDTHRPGPVEVTSRPLAQPVPTETKQVDLPTSFVTTGVPTKSDHFEETSETLHGPSSALHEDIIRMQEQIRELQNITRRRPAPKEWGFQAVEPPSQESKRRRNNWSMTSSQSDKIYF